jgi:hypothetical protein
MFEGAEVVCGESTDVEAKGMASAFCDTLSLTLFTFSKKFVMIFSFSNKFEI